MIVAPHRLIGYIVLVVSPSRRLENSEISSYLRVKDRISHMIVMRTELFHSGLSPAKESVALLDEFQHSKRRFEF